MAEVKYLRYCRVCANKKDSSRLKSLVDNGQELFDITKKIAVLHIQFSSEDNLPQEICHNCLPRVEMTFTFITACRKAQLKLIQLAHSGVNFKDSIVVSQEKDKALQPTIKKPLSPKTESPETEPKLEHNKDKTDKTPYSKASVNDDETPYSITSVNDEKIKLEAINATCETDTIAEAEDWEPQIKDEKKNLDDPPSPKQEPSPSKIYRCAPCNKTYQTSSGLSFHNQSVHSQTSLLCELCGKPFRHQSNLKAHRKTHLSEDFKKLHSCVMCDKRFGSKFLLKEHINLHYNLKPYSCSVCDKAFHGIMLLNKHMETHENPNSPYECDTCGRKLLQRSGLIAHIRRHGRPGGPRCNLCGVRFDSRRELRQHSVEVHTQEEMGERKKRNDWNVAQCPVCHKYLSRTTLPSHIKSHTATEQFPLRCEVCGKGLAGRSSLSYHMRAFHSGEKGPWQCQYCEERFLTKEMCRRHEYKHTGDKPFKCTQCIKSFRCLTSLRQHRLVHEEASKHRCEVCHKQFKRKAALAVHSRIHSGDLPFKCSQCPKKFAQKNDMLKHQAAIHEKVMRCPSCDVCFPNTKQYTEHCAMCSQNTVGSAVLKKVLQNHSLLDAKELTLVQSGVSDQDALPQVEASINQVTTMHQEGVLLNSSSLDHNATLSLVEEVNYLCTLCNVTFDSEQRLNRHFQGFHGAADVTLPLTEFHVEYTL